MMETSRKRDILIWGLARDRGGGMHREVSPESQSQTRRLTKSGVCRTVLIPFGGTEQSSGYPEALSRNGRGLLDLFIWHLSSLAALTGASVVIGLKNLGLQLCLG